MTSSVQSLPTSKPQKIFVDWGYRIAQLLPHVILIGYSVLALFPTVLILMNSFKDRKDLFKVPYTPPIWFSFDGGFHVVNLFSTKGYEQVLARASIFTYFGNSLFVTVLSLFLILLLGSMASFALSEYEFKGNRLLGLYMAIGIMIPIRLGTVSLIRLMNTLGVYNTQWALILVYTASGLPIAVFIMTEFMRQVPVELKDAARVDGASEYRILFSFIIPLVRPALATVLVFNMLPIWNDLWFPLTLAPGGNVRTVTLGLSEFAGQYKTDWTALLAALVLAMIPVLLLYIVFSRQFIQGLTRGALK
ncbi:MAG: ABC transporter permease subunit [Anaerolineaceae bacterium]|nr:ABC transporter permease subunit [Anaerolineaceae bacterium]